MFALLAILPTQNCQASKSTGLTSVNTNSIGYAHPAQILYFTKKPNFTKHHRSMHAETYSSCCDTRKSLLSDHCKAILSQCFREAAGKRAWGCLCCLSCFNTLGAWNQHMIVHQIHNGKVQN